MLVLDAALVDVSGFVVLGVSRHHSDQHRSATVASSSWFSQGHVRDGGGSQPLMEMLDVVDEIGEEEGTRK